MWSIDPVVTHYKPTEAVSLNPVQRVAMWLSTLFSVLALLGILRWAISTDTDENFLGGMGDSSTWEDHPEKLLSWAPVCQVIAFTFCTTQARFAYRYQAFLHNRLGLFGEKLIELFWSTTAVAFMCFGLFATVEYNSIMEEPQLGTLQSWLEVAVVTLYGAHYILGFWHFFYPGSRMETRRAYYPAHVFFGIFNYFVGNLTILSWIVYKNYDKECWYSLDWKHKDYNPATRYTEIPLGCRYSNGVGVLIYLTVMCGSYAMMDMKATVVRRNARRSSFFDVEEDNM